MSGPLDNEEKPKRTRRRAASVGGEEATQVAKPRKTAVKKTTTKKAVVKKTPTRRVAKKPVEDDSEAKVLPSPLAKEPADLDNVKRKAPTEIASQEVECKQKKKQLIIVAVLLLVGLGSSAAVGVTDKGQINVNQTIEARNDRIRTNQVDDRDVLNSTVEVPVQNTSSNQADGGLILGVMGNAPKPAAEIVPGADITEAEMASSTTEMASSTDPVESEEVPEEAVPTSEAEETTEESDTEAAEEEVSI